MLLVIVGALLAACGKPKEEAKELVVKATPTAVNDLPAITVVKADNSNVFLKELTGRVLILFFNPDCDHCQREASLLSQNKDVLNGWQVYFLSPDTMESITKFSKDYNLIESNIHFGHVDGQQVVNAVGPINTVPTFLIYDNQAFVARMEGEITLPKLKQMLK